MHIALTRDGGCGYDASTTNANATIALGQFPDAVAAFSAGLAAASPATTQDAAGAAALAAVSTAAAVVAPAGTQIIAGACTSDAECAFGNAKTPLCTGRPVALEGAGCGFRSSSAGVCATPPVRRRCRCRRRRRNDCCRHCRHRNSRSSTGGLPIYYWCMALHAHQMRTAPPAAAQRIPSVLPGSKARAVDSVARPRASAPHPPSLPHPPQPPLLLLLSPLTIAAPVTSTGTQLLPGPARRTPTGPLSTAGPYLVQESQTGGGLQLYRDQSLQNASRRALGARVCSKPLCAGLCRGAAGMIIVISFL
ncbi:hypothetical protein C8R44DRAFT_745499 [Mycena epipterygia]|nr:hypothetical protein C8R44DRAFT_745499 [Mycena epipterygia]